MNTGRLNTSVHLVTDEMDTPVHLVTGELDTPVHLVTGRLGVTLYSEQLFLCGPTSVKLLINLQQKITP